MIGAGVVLVVVAVLTALFAPSDIGYPVLAAALVTALIAAPAVFVALRQSAKADHCAAAARRAEQQLAATVAEATQRIAKAEEHSSAYAWEAQENSRRGAAALAAFAGAASRIQAMTTSMLAELREMEHRHADPRVLTDLLHIDHRTAQTGRLADSIAVLSGARTGRRWAKPIAMESILRGAMGRVAGYQRVRLRAVAEVGIAGHAAEGVMHALAELLDNACNFSPPTTEVHVYAAEVPAGVVITIEDSGLVMSESALRRAEAAVSGRDHKGKGADLAALSGTRLGLAVVGNLARKHDLTVSYRPSAIGGTAVVVVVPRELTARAERRGRDTGRHAAQRADTGGMQLTNLGQFDAPTPRPAPHTENGDLGWADAIARQVSPPATEAAAGPAQATPVLPKRRRGSTLAQVHPEGLTQPAPTQATPARPSALGAFQRAARTEPRTGSAASAPDPQEDR
ncbi:sensor histidine kinase [Nocardia caishijiensis]|uniref:histidine kinase n=1 Tax=Nocardia caishijiensis TaxID=184756 RepID=A0ABQ6YLZ8_9NOCA|nr:ATP-binding protein [Nocardia caishijiensis]KAF0846506.1 signal transduction histidine kinase [Nocardia caishijiensis]